MAGITRAEEEEKSAYILQLRLHCPQKKQACLSLLLGKASVRTDPLPGNTVTPTVLAAFTINNSFKRGLGGGRKMPSGSLSIPSLLPYTPIS